MGMGNGSLQVAEKWVRLREKFHQSDQACR